MNALEPRSECVATIWSDRPSDQRPFASWLPPPSSAAERRELRRLERETPLLISKEMKLIKQIVSTAAAGRATNPPLLSLLPPTEMAAPCTPRAKWKTTLESGCQMRHLPFRSKSLALVCQQLHRGRARIDCETPQFVHGTQLRGIFTLAPVPRGTGIGASSIVIMQKSKEC